MSTSHDRRAVAAVIGSFAALLAALPGTAAEATEPSAPAFDDLVVYRNPTVNPDWNGGPRLWFSASDPDGIRTVSATWCSVEVPDACVTPTTGDVAPGHATWQQDIWATVAEDAPLGLYELRGITIMDHAGQSSSYLPDGTVATSPAGVSGPATHEYDLDRDFVVVDHTAPTVSGISWPDGKVAVPADGPLRLDLAVADDWREPLWAEAWLKGPAGAIDTRLTLAGTLQGDGRSPVAGTLQATDPFDMNGYPSGEWTLAWIRVKDEAGNETVYYPDGSASRRESQSYQDFRHDLDLAGNALRVRNPWPQLIYGKPVADSKLRVSWEPAVDADGAAPSTYTVTARPWEDGLPDDQDQWATPDPEATPATTATVPGTETAVNISDLRNGRRYLVTVTAEMADGRRYTARPAEPFRPLPELGVSPEVTVVEGDGGWAWAVLTARLSSPSVRRVAVVNGARTGTATVGDFQQPASHPVFIAPGEVSTELRVPVIGDTDDEGNETFSVDFSPRNALAATQSSIVTIVDDDPAPGSPLAIGSVTSVGGGSGKAPAVFTVRLARPLKRAVTVSYRTRDRTALAGRDYASTRGRLRFDPGVRARFIRVPVYARPRITADSRFDVVLRDPDGTWILRRLGVGRIRR